MGSARLPPPATEPHPTRAGGVPIQPQRPTTLGRRNESLRARGAHLAHSSLRLSSRGPNFGITTVAGEALAWLPRTGGTETCAGVWVRSARNWHSGPMLGLAVLEDFALVLASGALEDAHHRFRMSLCRRESGAAESGAAWEAGRAAPTGDIGAQSSCRHWYEESSQCRALDNRSK